MSAHDIHTQPLTREEREMLYKQAVAMQGTEDDHVALYSLLACINRMDPSSMFPSLPDCFHKVRIIIKRSFVIIMNICVMIRSHYIILMIILNEITMVT